MVTFKQPTRCKLEISSEMIEQVFRFTYLGAELTSGREIFIKPENQRIKATQMAGSLRGMVWKNKSMNIAN